MHECGKQPCHEPCKVIDILGGGLPLTQKMWRNCPGEFPIRPGRGGRVSEQHRLHNKRCGRTSSGILGRARLTQPRKDS